MAYLLINQIKLNHEIYGEGPPLLFIHGLGSSIQDWENQVAHFANHYKVIVYDLRGHGKSDKPNGPYAVSQFASDTAILMRELNLPATHVVGHSLGGMIAFQLALDFPDLVKTLTIVNSAPTIVFSAWKNRMFLASRKLNVKILGLHSLSRSLGESLFPKPEQANLREQFITRWRENDPQAYLHSLHAFEHWDVTERLKTLDCPTLIITADRDYTTVAYKQAYLRHIKHAEFVVIHDSRHMTIIDQPEIFNKTLEVFLEKY